MELDVRGTPAWQIRVYLIGLEGREQSDGSFAGPGWTATLTESLYPAFGTQVPRVVMRLSGDEAKVATVAAALRLRSMRVGG